jgi:hypothetical protein
MQRADVFQQVLGGVDKSLWGRCLSIMTVTVRCCLPLPGLTLKRVNEETLRTGSEDARQRRWVARKLLHRPRAP